MPIVVILSLVAFEVLLIFVHLAVYGTLVAAFGIGSMVLGWVFVALALTFLTASLLTHWFKGRLIDWYYTASAYWFGLINVFFVAGVIFFFAAQFFYSRGDYVSPALIGGIAFGAFFLLHLYGTWNSGRAEITRVTVAMPGLPAAWRGKKLVFVSDMHLGNIRKDGFAAKVAGKINALRPDAVLIGGDLYDGTACDEKAVVEPLRALKAPQGVYYVTGNHEYYLPNFGAAMEAIRGVGIRIINNEVVNLDGLSVLGVDHKTTFKRDDFKRVLDATVGARKAPTILVMHEPNHLDAARDAGIALAFYGHTHQGQIFPLNYITRRVYHGFDYGLKKLGPLNVYTSSGVGTWGPPLRLGTKSEIVLVEFG